MGLPSKVGAGTAGTEPSLYRTHTQLQGKPGFLPAPQDQGLEFHLAFPSSLAALPRASRVLPLLRSPPEVTSQKPEGGRDDGRTPVKPGSVGPAAV